MEKLNGIIDSFKGIIEEFVTFFKNLVKQLREIGDKN